MDLNAILCHPIHKSLHAPHDADETDEILTPARRKQFFTMAHGRKVSAVSDHYTLPVDEEEINRMSIEHRMLRFVYGGKNYVGPVNDVLAPSRRRQRRVLDCGTGSGLWASEMADEFPHAQIIGVDVAPIQPEEVPVNCSYEIYDMTKGRRLLPYDAGYFDLVHMRSIYTGITDYPALLREASRTLRPGGLLILAEIDSTPMTEAKIPIPSGQEGRAPGWCAFWEAYRQCLDRRGVDSNLPTRLRSMLQQIGGFQQITAQEALIPVGFWPRDPILLTIGQLAWMNYDILLMSLRPLLLEHSGLPLEQVDKLITDAQSDLYYPEVRPNINLHIVFALKQL